MTKIPRGAEGGIDDLALIPEKHICVCPSLRGLDDDYEEVKAADQETSSLGAPGYSDFCGAVNSPSYTGCPKKTNFQNGAGATVHWLNHHLPAPCVSGD